MNMLEEVKALRRSKPTTAVHFMTPEEVKDLGYRLREDALDWESCRMHPQGPYLNQAARALGFLVYHALSIVDRDEIPWEATWRAVMAEMRGQNPASSTLALISHAMDAFREAPEPMTGIPRKVFTLCGSSKFKEAHEAAQARLTLDGHVVIPMGVYGHADAPEMDATTKADLDDLHLRKIDMSHGIFVVDPGGYVGESTRREILYAEAKGKEIRFLSKETH